MSREIKFRAWDKEKNQMFDTQDGHVDFGVLSNGDIVRGGGMSGDYNIDDGGGLIIMQYTGLIDKNGTEVFEGDILSDGAVVEWFDNLAWDSGGSLHPGYYCRKWSHSDEGDSTVELSYCNGWDECEVIGNIYENKDLIK